MQQEPPLGQESSWPSAFMGSNDYDNMFQNFANHISRSELLRRLSNHSTSTSGSVKKGSARVKKQTSASNSPNYVQRRRTTANHTRSYPRAFQDNIYETREQRLQNYYSSTHPVPSPRPVSWHPGSDAFQSLGTQPSTNRPALGNTIAGLDNLAVSKTPASSVQQSIQHAFAMGCSLSTPPPAPSYEPSTTGEIHQYASLASDPNSAFDSYPTYSISDHAQYQYTPQSLAYNIHPSTSYQSTQQWPAYSSCPPVNPPAQPEVPVYQPSQVPVNPARKIKVTGTPQLSRRKSKELIGMGLYDDKQSSFLSGLNLAANDVASQGSMGRGLKLEETWQPPNEDEEDVDDEGYSTEEAEEVEEAPQTITASAADTQTAVYPTCADMSNQSFLFNDDDDYINANQYANYLAYTQQFSDNQPKPQLNPTMENYMWL